MRQSTARKTEDAISAKSDTQKKNGQKTTVVSLPPHTPASNKSGKNSTPMTNQDYIEKMESGRFEDICESLGDFA